jgi:hypothetical protein
LGRLDTGKVFPLFINGDLVALANIEKIPSHVRRAGTGSRNTKARQARVF